MSLKFAYVRLRSESREDSGCCQAETTVHAPVGPTAPSEDDAEEGLRPRQRPSDATRRSSPDQPEPKSDGATEDATNSGTRR